MILLPLSRTFALLVTQLALLKTFPIYTWYTISFIILAVFVQELHLKSLCMGMANRKAAEKLSKPIQ